MTAATGNRTPRHLLANPEFLALASLQFARGLAYATILIALALYVDLFSVSGVVAGLFGTVYAGVRLFTVLPLGRAADRGNKKQHMLAGLSLYGIVLLGFIYVGAVSHVIVLRVLQGLSSTLLILTGTSVVGEICPDEERGLWIGTFNQARALSSLIGDLVGGALLFTYGFTVTYAVLVAATVVATVAVFVFLRDDPGADATDDRSGRETLVRLLKRRAVAALVAFRFTFSFGKMAVVLFLPIYARTAFGMSALLIGGILAGGKLTKAIAQGHVGTLSDRLGNRSWFIVAGTLVYALGTAAIPFADVAQATLGSVSVKTVGRTVAVPGAAFLLFGSYVLLGLADSLRLPTSMTLFVEEGRHYDAVAGSLSLRSVSWQVGGIVGPLAAGAVLDAVSFAAAFWLASFVMVLAALAFVLLYAVEPPPEGAVVDDPDLD